MQAQRLNITLPYEIARDLRRSIPARKRSRFIAESIKKSLPKKDLKKDLIKSLKINKDIYIRVSREITEDFKYADADAWEKLP